MITNRIIREVAMFEFSNIEDKKLREFAERCFVLGAVWAANEKEKEQKNFRPEICRN